MSFLGPWREGDELGAGHPKPILEGCGKTSSMD